jgi:tetratricopeptide (TPR) repeat protein
MRTVFATLCAAALALPAPALASAGAVEPAAGQSAEELYEAGRRDYRLGRFSEAIAKWEAAYAQAELPLLLYNIALAYRQLYDVSSSVDDLRKGRVVLRNFLVIAERDPEVDPADAQKLMDEIDELIANSDEGKPAPVVDDGGGDDKPIDPRPVPVGPDPGKSRRIIGGSVMGAGGAFVLAGVVIGIVYGLEGSRWRDALGRAKDEDAEARQRFVDSGMGDPDANVAAYDEFSKMQCTLSDGRTLAADSCSDVIAKFRSNGQGANRTMALGLGLGGGLGVAAIVAGAVVFVQGNRRTRDWRAGAPAVARTIRVHPVWMGLGVSGRF